MLTHTKFLVKERVAMLRLVDTYDIFDPATGQQIGLAQEVVPLAYKLLRFVLGKGMLPTTVEIKESPEAAPLMTIRRGFTFLRSKIWLEDAQGRQMGYFKSKLMALLGGFFVYDYRDNLIAEVKGGGKGWHFTFLSAQGQVLGTVTKQWAGVGKEFFTSADNYMIALADDQGRNPALVAFLLAAGLAVDICATEH